MKIVGQVSNKEEASIVQFAAKVSLVGNRARDLAASLK